MVHAIGRLRDRCARTCLTVALAFVTNGCSACSEVHEVGDPTPDAFVSDDAAGSPDGPIFHELPTDVGPALDGRGPDGVADTPDAAWPDAGGEAVASDDHVALEIDADALVHQDLAEVSEAAEGADGGGVTPSDVSPTDDAAPPDADAATPPDADAAEEADAACSVAGSCDPVTPPGFVLVEPCTFLMGSPPDEPGRGTDEAQHEVHLTHRLLVALHEVTQAEWRAVMGAAAATSWFPSCGDACPVENVSWWSALRYCNERSVLEGLPSCYTLTGCSGQPGASFACDQVAFAGPACAGFRLPTEAEWEYAARAGTSTSLYSGALPIEHLDLDSPEADAVAWYGGNSGASYAGAWDCSAWKKTQYPAASCGTHPVQQKAPNAWGLYDVSGNVWEWCWDAWAPFDSGASATDPLGATDPTFRTLRGGSWMIGAARVRSANRGRYEPDVRNGATGLRVVRTVP